MLVKRMGGLHKPSKHGRFIVTLLALCKDISTMNPSYAGNLHQLAVDARDLAAVGNDWYPLVN